MSFSVNISGHIHAAGAEAEEAEKKILEDLHGLVNRLRGEGHSASGGYSGPGGSFELGGEPAGDAAGADVPTGDQPQQQDVGVTDVATAAPAGEQAGGTVPSIEEQVTTGQDTEPGAGAETEG